VSGCGLAPLSRGQKWPADLGEVVHAAAQRMTNTPSPSPRDPAVRVRPGVICVVDPRHWRRTGVRWEAARLSKALIDLGGALHVGRGPAQAIVPDNLGCRSGGDPDRHHASNRDLDLGAGISSCWGAVRGGAPAGVAA
jgi:hypothetical protein